jgi:hypothetical protein
MVTIQTDKTGRKFEVHTDIFGSVVKQVEIFDVPEAPEQPKPEVKKPEVKKVTKKGK